MEAAQIPPDQAPAAERLQEAAQPAAKKERTPTTYAVYQTQQADAIKDGIASELVLLKSDVKATTELDARWQVVDADAALTERINKGEELHLVALPMRRALVRVTKLVKRENVRRA